jgi:hypothetical protein
VAEAATAGQIFAVRLPSTEEDDEPWAALPSRRSKEPSIEGTLPDLVEIVLGNQVYIDRSNIPPGLVNRIARLGRRLGDEQCPGIHKGDARGHGRRCSDRRGQIAQWPIGCGPRSHNLRSVDVEADFNLDPAGNRRLVSEN